MAGRGAGGRFAVGNTFGSARLGFGVGVPEFLESEANKARLYWRGLEYGSDKFIGKVFYGVFGAPGQGSRYQYRGGGFYGVSREFGNQSQFFPLGYAASNLTGGSGTPTKRILKYLSQFAVRSDKSLTYERGRSIRMVIERPIEAQEAYAKAYKAFDAPKQEEAAVLQVLKNAGIAVEGRGGVIDNQRTVLFRDMRTRQKKPVSNSAFVARVGVLSGGAISGYTGSLAKIDQSYFQRELVEINRVLAEGLAQKVAELQQEAIKRKGTETGKLVASTVDPRNRYPQ